MASMLLIVPNLGIRKFLSKTVGRLAAGQAWMTPYGFIAIMNLRDNTNRIIFERGLGSVASFIEAMPSNAFFLDIGGNQGGTALLASNIPSRQVVVLEPSTKIYQRMIKNIELNYRSNIIALNYGVASSERQVFINDDDDGHSGGSHVSEQGSVVSLKPISRQDLDLWGVDSRPVYVKIDTEGFELEVIQGIGSILEAGMIVMLVVEIDKGNLSRYDASVEQLYETMKNYGYAPTVEETSNHYDEVFVQIV